MAIIKDIGYSLRSYWPKGEWKRDRTSQQGSHSRANHFVVDWLHWGERSIQTMRRRSVLLYCPSPLYETPNAEVKDANAKHVYIKIGKSCQR